MGRGGGRTRPLREHSLNGEREAFDLVRIQGLTYAEAAELLGVAPKTVQRRLDRGLQLLTERLGDLGPGATPPGPS